MSRWQAGLCVVATAVVIAAVCACAQEQPTFTVDVKLVRVLATVKNAKGDLVGSLGKQDFEVYDNDVRQEVAVFEHHTEVPLSIALLVDTSASTAIEMKYELESVQRFLRALLKEGNPSDSVALYAFNWETVEMAGFTHNIARLENAVRGMKSAGGTSLYDATSFAADALDDRDGTRHVIVVITDGGDTTSAKTFHQALESAQRADAVIYPILVMPITNEAGRNIGGEHALTLFAQGTGGRVFTPSDRAEVDRAFAEIIRDLRTQYLIGFYPKNVPPRKDPFHRLKIKLRRQDLQVLARSGYYGESEIPKQPAGWRPVR